MQGSFGAYVLSKVSIRVSRTSGSGWDPYTRFRRVSVFSENPGSEDFSGALRAPKKSKSEPSFLDVLANFIFFIPEFSLKI